MVTVLTGCFLTKHAICIFVFNFYSRHIFELAFALLVRQIHIPRQKYAEKDVPFSVFLVGILRVILVLMI